MGEFAKDMTRRMHDQRLTQAELARKVPLSTTHVSRLVNGLREPTPEMARRIDAVLGAGGELAVLAKPRQPSTPATGHSQHPLAAADVERIRADIDRLVGLDTAHGSAGLHQVATRAFRAAEHRLAIVGAQPAIAADAASAIAELGEVAAWMAYDEAAHDQSRRLAGDALLVARTAGDTSMQRFLLSHVAMQAVQTGRPAEALSIANMVLAEEPVSPMVRAMFHTRRARALGLMGALGDGLAELEHARRIVTAGRTTADPAWSWWLHQAELAIQRGRLLVDTGNPRQAVTAVVEAIDLLPAGQGRDRMLYQGWLGRCLVEAHAWSDAMPVLDRLARSGGVGSARLRPILAGALTVVDGPGVRAPRRVRDAVRDVAARLDAK